MRVELNDEAVVLDSADELGNMDDLIRAVCSHDKPGRPVIKRLLVNGRKIPVDSPCELDMDPSKVESIAVWTDTLKNFVRDSLKDGVEMIRQLRQSVQSNAEKLRMGKEVEAAERMAVLFDELRLTWHFMAEVERRLPAILGQAETPRLTETYDRFFDLCSQLEGAQLANDTVLLADLLEYELDPLMEEWSESMRSVFPDWN